MQIKYPEIGICGLSCRLCPIYNTKAESRCLGCKSLIDIQSGIANMGMKEPNPPIYGQIVQLGYQDLFVRMVTRNVITNQHQGEVKPEHKEEKDPMKEVKYLNNFVWKY